MSRQFSVLQWQPGYMPWDDDPPTFSDRRSAESYAVVRARELRVEGMIVTGNSQNGYTVTDPEASEHHLGWYLEVVETEKENENGG
jgi:hypothetical protein